MELSLDTPIRFVPRVGPMMASRMKRLHIQTVEDMLFHVPFRYDDFTLVSKIGEAQPGETVTIKGAVQSFANFATKTGKRVQEARITDETGKLSIIWFNQPYLRSVIREGQTYHFSGVINWFGHKLVMNSPAYEPVGVGGTTSLHTGRLVPVYPETEGVSSKWMRGRIAFILEQVGGSIEEFLPEEIRATHHLMGRREAVNLVHFPADLAVASEARRRLAFDELLILQLRSYEQKHQRETEETAHALTVPGDDVTSFIAQLPFTLTDDQKTATDSILTDLERPFPMNRLLEGDVGSGKTVVAAIAMYVATRNGLTAVLMAPTQILAQQHFDTISTLFAPLGIPVELVTSDTRKKKGKRQQFLPSSVFIGTHALLSDTHALGDLGLVVVDEQHRFGVSQRSQLLGKNQNATHPHLLTMTATPIPRTVAKTMFGHLDMSALQEMPVGRQKVKTWAVPKEKREKAYAWITSELTKTGGQAFVICPLIEESESLADVKAVTKEYEAIKKIFPQFGVGLLHGRMKAPEKTATLGEFRKKHTTILVATPVVEVGIDIPNATIMVIEGSERFGLGQLHQLRGRVGRGSLQSYCLLFTHEEDEKILKRLKALETVYSGPLLAEIDLTLRGPGEILGTRQHGIPDLKIASFTDTASIDASQRALRQLTDSDPELTASPLLRETVKKGTITTLTQD